MAAIDIWGLSQACSVLIEPAITYAIIQTESGGNPYTIYVNNTHKSLHILDKQKAIQYAKALIAKKSSIDLGLMQINSQWLQHYALTVEETLEPCTNIQIGTAILSMNYNRYLAKHFSPTEAMYKAFSAYNTGSDTKGIPYANRIVDIINQLHTTQIFTKFEKIMPYQENKSFFINDWVPATPTLAPISSL